MNNPGYLSAALLWSRKRCRRKLLTSPNLRTRAIHAAALHSTEETSLQGFANQLSPPKLPCHTWHLCMAMLTNFSHSNISLCPSCLCVYFPYNGLASSLRCSPALHSGAAWDDPPPIHIYIGRHLLIHNHNLTRSASVNTLTPFTESLATRLNLMAIAKYSRENFKLLNQAERQNCQNRYKHKPKRPKPKYRLNKEIN